MLCASIVCILLGFIVMLSTGFVFRNSCTRISRRSLNRIIVERNEVQRAGDKKSVVSFSQDDPRAQHILNVWNALSAFWLLFGLPSEASPRY